jgi:hypothetical protein
VLFIETSLDDRRLLPAASHDPYDPSRTTRGRCPESGGNFGTTWLPTHIDAGGYVEYDADSKPVTPPQGQERLRSALAVRGW